MIFKKRSVWGVLLVAFICLLICATSATAITNNNGTDSDQASLSSVPEASNEEPLDLEVNSKNFFDEEIRLKTRSSQKGNANQTSSPAKYPPFFRPIVNAVSCQVCFVVLANSMVQIETYMRAKDKDSVSHAESNELIENVCNPSHIAGAWLHKLKLSVEEVNEASEENESVSQGSTNSMDDESSTEGNALATAKNFSLKISSHVSFNTVCKRTCQTAAKICEALMESTEFDGLAKDLSERSKEDFESEEIHDELREKYCGHLVQCVESEKFMNALNKLLNKPDSLAKKQIEGDEVEFIEDRDEQFKLFSRKAGLLTKLNNEDFLRIKALAEEQKEKLRETMETSFAKDFGLEKKDTNSSQQPLQSTEENPEDSNSDQHKPESEDDL